MNTISPELLYSQIDVFPTAQIDNTPKEPKTLEPVNVNNDSSSHHLCGLMQELVSTQDRQSMLLEQLIALMTNGYRQRAVELGLWKLSNPELADYCKKAAKKLERVQNDLLSTITGEVDNSDDTFFDGEFGLTEFLDKYGPKLMQLDMMIRTLRQLGNAPDIKVQTNNV
ncbi:hypothetical protein FACS1894170_09070 [Planctomycetales bacterium]|nr:hypothetical protein FACS1894170_09070 [Planctomycetales bacterium]